MLELPFSPPPTPPLPSPSPRAINWPVPWHRNFRRTWARAVIIGKKVRKGRERPSRSGSDRNGNGNALALRHISVNGTIVASDYPCTRAPCVFMYVRQYVTCYKPRITIPCTHFVSKPRHFRKACCIAPASNRMRLNAPYPHMHLSNVTTVVI